MVEIEIMNPSSLLPGSAVRPPRRALAEVGEGGVVISLALADAFTNPGLRSDRVRTIGRASSLWPVARKSAGYGVARYSCLPRAQRHPPTAFFKARDRCNLSRASGPVRDRQAASTRRSRGFMDSGQGCRGPHFLTR